MGIQETQETAVMAGKRRKNAMELPYNNWRNSSGLSMRLKRF
jgi:hypothetical protein